MSKHSPSMTLSKKKLKHNAVKCKIQNPYKIGMNIESSFILIQTIFLTSVERSLKRKVFFNYLTCKKGD